MIEVSQSAERYLIRLIEAQDEAGLGLRLAVREPGTPRAVCDLQFCSESEAGEDDARQDLGDLVLYLAADSRQWLTEASMDYLAKGAGQGELVIRAPNIRGGKPADDAALEDRVRWILDNDINPQVAAHGGQVSLVEVTAEREVHLRFGGGCHGCGMVDVTLKNGVEQTLKDELPDITAVRDVTDHSTGENPYYD